MAQYFLHIIVIILFLNQAVAFQRCGKILFNGPVRRSGTSQQHRVEPKCQDQVNQKPILGEISLANALAGPGYPNPFPRTVTQVVAFSLPTALGWYGW